jgi:Ricin-type beta-trefoil lectin domain
MTETLHAPAPEIRNSVVLPRVTAVPPADLFSPDAVPSSPAVEPAMGQALVAPPRARRPRARMAFIVAAGAAVLIAVPLLVVSTQGRSDRHHTSSAANGLPYAGKSAASAPVGSNPGAPAPKWPGAAPTLSSPVPRPTVSPTVSPTHSNTPKEQRHLAALAAQQGGETAPRMPRVVYKNPKKAAPKTAKAKAKASAHARVRAAAASRLPTGPNFGSVTDVLIRNVLTGMCADIPGIGPGKGFTPIQEYRCNGSTVDNQLWDLVVKGKGAGPNGADLFMIRNSKDGQCVDLEGRGTVASQTRVVENLCIPGSGDNQMWFLQKRGSNSFWIRNSVINDWCLDVEGLRGSQAALTIYPCSSSDDHEWSFS